MKFKILSFIIVLGFSFVAVAWRTASRHRPQSALNSVSGPNEKESPNCGPCKMAPLCSGEFASQGCDGTGRISGGVGAVLPWFPVKVYRPCPSYLAAGYQYKREGQTMDQVLFSEPSDKMKAKMKEIQKLKSPNEGEQVKVVKEEVWSGPDPEVLRILREGRDGEKKNLEEK